MDPDTQNLINRLAGIAFGVLLPIGFLSAGLWLLSAQALAIWQGMQSRSWPTSDGIVQYSGWHSYTSNGAYIGANYDASSFLHQPDVRYRYVVANQTYGGQRVSFHDHRESNLGNVKAIVARYPVGAPVEVHYDPADPSRAVLETGVGGANWLFLGISLIFLLVGGGIGWLGIRTIRRA